MKFSIKTITTILLTLVSLNALSSEMRRSTGKVRANKVDASVKLNYFGSMSIDGQGGSIVDLNDDMGFGFEIGYNYSEHFNTSIEFTYNQVGYSALLVPDDPNESNLELNNKLDVFNTQFNFTYNFSNKKLTPFVAGGFGWAYIDTNIPTGGFVGICWWDPWWGYVCDSVPDTYDEYEFNYSAEVGFRFDLNQQMYLIGSVGNQWFDFDNGGTSETEVIKLEFGMKY